MTALGYTPLQAQRLQARIDRDRDAVNDALTRMFCNVTDANWARLTHLQGMVDSAAMELRGTVERRKR